MQGSGTGGIPRSVYRAFTADLRYGFLVPESPLALALCATPGFNGIYRRDSADGGLTGLCSVSEGPRNELIQPELQGIAPDARSAVFRVNDELTADAPPLPDPARSSQLYLWTEGRPLRLLSILPGGEPYEGTSSAGSQGPGSAIPTGTYNNLARTAHALSADGSRIYWSTSPGSDPTHTHPGPLYLRVNAAQPPGEECGSGQACTLPVSEAAPGAEEGEAAQFWTATLDGSEAIFSITEGELAGNLYRYDLASEEATLIAEGTEGVAGASEDLSRIYFASEEDLTPGQANGRGEEAEEGQPNLYLDEAGVFTFIGRLLGEDVSRGGEGGFPSPVASTPLSQIARVSPDGRHLAFVAAAPLSGYDNRDAVSGQRDREVYLYEAGGDLLCASCAPSGARPAGANLKHASGEAPSLWTAAWIPGVQSELYQRRSLSEDGKRLFFNSVDELLPGDSNGKQDVYEWEAPGTGSCQESDANYFKANGGCLSLISSGESPRDSEFVDASADGSDVFFRTASSLVGADPGLVDVYDARIGGGFPEAGEPAGCEGQACQSPPGAPALPGGATATHRGPGNLKEAGGASRCGAQARKAQSLSKRARRLRRNAKRVARNGKAARARALRRKAHRLARRAKGRSNNAKRCRRRARNNRRAAR